MASRARFAAAALLAASTLTGLAAGTAGADPQPGTDRATGRDAANSVSERRSAARAEKPTADEPRRPRCKRRDPECGGLGTPPAPEAPPSSDSRDRGGLPGGLPGRPAPPELPWIPPPLNEPQAPDVVDTVPGVGLPLNSPVGAPISVPVLPVPAVAAPRPAAPAGPAPRPQAPPPGQVAGDPRPVRAPEPVARPNATPAAGPVSAPTSFRVGYPEYLRGAGLPQIAAIALPGLAGIMVLTGAGGLLGYRQAKAGRVIAVRGGTRFMN